MKKTMLDPQVHTREAGGVALDEHPATDQATGESTQPETVTLRLLHVEDNPADALLMQEYIRGILPDITFDTAVRLSEVTAERVAAVDCALLDLSLPDASGLDALLALRSMSEDLPIIVLTGFDNMELGLTAVRDGADDYLLKNHVDGYTLERAVQYSIERRRLMLQLAKSAAEAIVATATSITADAATDEALKRVGEGAAGDQPPVALNAAEGTHQVAVRIDRDSHEFVLSCDSCGWEAERGPDHVHSWSSRSLELTLLHHVDFERNAQAAAVAPVDPSVQAAPSASEPAQAPERSTVGRRSMFRPRDWVA